MSFLPELSTILLYGCIAPNTWASQSITYCGENTSWIDLPGRFGPLLWICQSLMILFLRNIFLHFVYLPQLHFVPLCVLPHGEMIAPSIILKRISSKKQLVWNLLHLWRSEQSCSTGVLGKMKSLFSLNATYGAAADSLPTASIISVGWALGINRPQFPSGPGTCTAQCELSDKSCPALSSSKPYSSKAIWISSLCFENWGVVLPAV